MTQPTTRAEGPEHITLALALVEQEAEHVRELLADTLQYEALYPPDQLQAEITSVKTYLATLEAASTWLKTFLPTPEPAQKEETTDGTQTS